MHILMKSFMLLTMARIFSEI